METRTNLKLTADNEVVAVDLRWAQVLPMLLVLLETGTPQGRKFATAELGRMAAIADSAVHGKGGPANAEN